MSDASQTTAVKPRDAAVEPIESTKPVDGAAEVEEPQDAPNGNREAAKYRRQLRDVEGERDALTERVERLTRAEVERIAGKVLDKPAGFWAAGIELSSVLTENGDVDTEKVTTAAESAREELGLQKPSRGAIIPSQGKFPEDKAVIAGFESAFAPR